jgi:hypothetical protein
MTNNLAQDLPSMLEGATENAAVVQALLDNLIQRGLDPTLCRLFIVDGSKAAGPSRHQEPMSTETEEHCISETLLPRL